MQLLQELLQLIELKIQNTEVLNKGDLTMIMNALYKVERVETKVNCLTKAAVEAIRILTGIKLSTRDFDTKSKGGAPKGSDDYEKIHPNTLVKVAKGGVERSDGTSAKYDLHLRYIDSKQEILSTVRAGVPVILSIVWRDLFFYPVVWVTRPKQKQRIETYRELGADKEMLDRVMKDHIVPYPNDELIKRSKEVNDPHSHVKHAVLVVGYDAGQRAFICRDYSIHNGEEMGFFKVDERIFFDEKLKHEGMATIEAALVIEVEEANESA